MINIEKYIQWVNYNAVADNTALSLFVVVLLPPKFSKSREKFELIGLAVQGHPRSSILDLVSIESANATSY